MMKIREHASGRWIMNFATLCIAHEYLRNRRDPCPVRGATGCLYFAVRPVSATVISFTFIERRHVTPAQLDLRTRSLDWASPTVTMPYQFKLPGFDDWLPEALAAKYVGLDLQTLRDLRANNRKGLTPFRECGGEYYYLRADLDGWLAKNAQRNAGKSSGIFLT